MVNSFHLDAQFFNHSSNVYVDIHKVYFMYILHFVILPYFHHDTQFCSHDSNICMWTCTITLYYKVWTYARYVNVKVFHFCRRIACFHHYMPLMCIWTYVHKVCKCLTLAFFYTSYVVCSSVHFIVIHNSAAIAAICTWTYIRYVR